ncbi:probable cytochrome P450 304a1 [Spodoptera frugiperda]|uniref:Probable cytochrome P450 304a1 n=1 Tax=Spodoptera frugiperda TaxID=7108 RepID=A0A9R0EBF9_SPOFR|nr:probable cytochrome P450 304a1 [Spodoptera frugiperda]ULR85459.1 cytochrome P450 [Spodoptera frugiperda]
MIVLTILAALFLPYLIIYLYKNAYNRPKNFPPGPPSLPIYGAFWIVLAHGFTDLASAFKKLGEKYQTKILGLYMGPVPTVVLNDPELIKEMLNREEFDGRMDIILFRLRSFWKKLGIFFTDGYFWHLQRRFSLRYLRDYGFGRRSEELESVVSTEIKEMIDLRISGPKYPVETEIVKGDLVYMPYFFSIPFLNGMLQVFSRSTLPRSEYKALWDLARGTVLFQRSSTDMGGALSLTPWLKDVLPNYSGYNDLVKGNEYLLKFFKKLIHEAMETHDETYDRHFLDMYITKMKEEMRQKDKTTYSVDQLILTCTDYTFPAASAVQFVLAILVERLLLQPEIQDKIHEEIDRVVGRDRLPNLDDRRNMPYLEACIRETMRYDTTVPLSVPHRAMKDTTIAGYDVPEGTMVSANLTMLHMNKELWGDPENFRPERFLKDGELDLASDKSLPFGAGRRLCAGETYARQSMFQVFAGFMQTFHVSTADGKPLLKPAKRIQGIITTIPEFWVKVTVRK